MHESQMWENNSFITLTYNNENLPKDGSISKKALQNFFKRYRKRFPKNTIRYFACGEYGDLNGRPHYHAILFGEDFSHDRYLWSTNKRGEFLYRSPTLESLWVTAKGKESLGHSSIGNVTFDSCAYVARYVMKKRKGKPDEIDPKTGRPNSEYYNQLDTATGEIKEIQPEFCIMSRGRKNSKDFRNRGGIGIGWLQRYKTDTDKDFITLDGHKAPIPKYYDKILEEHDKDLYDKRKKERAAQAIKRKEDNTLERLEVKAKVRDQKIKSLSREL